MSLNLLAWKIPLDILIGNYGKLPKVSPKIGVLDEPTKQQFLYDHARDVIARSLAPTKLLHLLQNERARWSTCSDAHAKMQQN